MKTKISLKEHSIICFILFLVIFFLIILIIYESIIIEDLQNQTDYKKNSTNKMFVNSSIGKFTYSNITYVQPNYSNIRYINIFPKNEKFVYLECVNSTLKINSHKIWCEK